MKKLIIILVLCLFLTSCTSEAIYIKKAEEKDEFPFKAHYIDLENGKSTFFELPNGECMLVDCGTTDDFPKIYEYLKNCDVGIIDYIVITSNDLHHLGGAKKVIQNFTVHEMFVSKCIMNKSLYQSTANEAVSTKCLIHTAEGGTEIYSDDDLNISIVSPINELYNKMEDYALSLMISYGSMNFFVEGDCGLNSEIDMCTSIGKYLKSDVLSVANSGADLTSSTDFLQKISPKYAVIQVFGENKPEKRILKVLEALGTYALRTDTNGNIVITSNKNAIVDIKTER